MSVSVQVIEIPLPMYKWLVGRCRGFLAPGRKITDLVLVSAKMPLPENVGPEQGRWEDVEFGDPLTWKGRIGEGLGEGLRTGIIMLAVALAVILLIKLF